MFYNTDPRKSELKIGGFKNKMFSAFVLKFLFLFKEGTPSEGEGTVRLIDLLR